MNVFIGCSSSQNISAEYLKVAKSVAQKLAALQLDLVFGAASTSMMGECYRAFENNNVEAVTVKTYENDLKNLTQAKSYLEKNTFCRLDKIYQLSDVFVILPGGVGTLTELISILEELRTSKDPKLLIIYNYRGFFDKILNLFTDLKNQGFISQELNNYYQVVDNENKIIELIKENYNERN